MELLHGSDAQRAGFLTRPGVGDGEGGERDSRQTFNFIGLCAAVMLELETLKRHNAKRLNGLNRKSKQMIEKLRSRAIRVPHQMLKGV